MALRDVLVMMAKKFYDLLVHGFIKMEQISLLVIDECHHTDQEHLYNLIMRDFYYHNFNADDPNCKRPRVLGLTASPIKQKIESRCVLPDDIEKMLQNLANNLYSRYVTISLE
jgi:ERCC4-related helicase